MLVLVLGSGSGSESESGGGLADPNPDQGRTPHAPRSPPLLSLTPARAGRPVEVLRVAPARRTLPGRGGRAPRAAAGAAAAMRHACARARLVP